MSSLLASLFPYIKFSRIVPKMRTGSCETYPILFRKLTRSKQRTSVPSKVILPSSGSYKRLINQTIVDLPHPLGPTIAVDVPCLIIKLALKSTSRDPSGAVGYLNWTPSNLIPSPRLMISVDYVVSSGEAILGVLSITSKISLPTTSALIIAGTIGKMDPKVIRAIIVA